MSIILKLQKKCLDKNESLQDLLREALVISTKLKLDDFKEWINSELRGYSDNIPNYRIINVQLKFFNPYRGWIDAIVNKEFESILSRVDIKQSIVELENMLIHYQEHKTIQMHLKGEFIIEIQKLYKIDFKPAQFVNYIEIYRIINEVRNLLLEWTLKLEEDGIIGNDDLIFTEKEKEMAKNINIQNFNGILGDVSNNSNFSIEDNSTNIYNENINKLIDEIKKLNLKEEKQIILDLEASKTNKSGLNAILGNLLTRFSEVATITSLVKELLI
ncbi:AbiTii domain-containing protein [Aliarcobacter vitoriensis]|uniref:AbiTii domain-containing protein n=1 Tax=Aliarcobacter vitoriensis TaxID=2011099 RepID=A0A366MUM9_9BACT|nr:hypothetical protein [Aliarcobacter vitoriensis]RBQ29955.1 hypothetical protein CRU91_01360 [Aliarcobacter vitoriensis]